VQNQYKEDFLSFDLTWLMQAPMHMERVHNLFGEWNSIQHAYCLWIAATVLNFSTQTTHALVWFLSDLILPNYVHQRC
jgi:hypothetical protein